MNINMLLLNSGQNIMLHSRYMYINMNPCYPWKLLNQEFLLERYVITLEFFQSQTLFDCLLKNDTSNCC